MTTGYQDQAIGCEGYGPSGVVVLVTGANLTATQRAAVREVLRRHGGSGGGVNSVAYLFHEVGVLRYASTGRLAQRALEAGAEAVEPLASGEVQVITDPQELQSVRARLASQGHIDRSAVITRRTERKVPLTGAQALAVQAMVAELAAISGVDGVFTNACLADGQAACARKP